MLKDRITRITFLISLGAHLLFLTMPVEFVLGFVSIKKPRELIIEVEIGEPNFLSDVKHLEKSKKSEKIEKKFREKIKEEVVKPQPMVKKMTFQKVVKPPPILEKKIVDEPKPTVEEKVIEKEVPLLQVKEKPVVKEVLPNRAVSESPSILPDKNPVIAFSEPETRKMVESNITVEDSMSVEDISSEPEETVEVGAAGVTRKAILEFQQMVRKRIEDCKYYPLWAKKRGFEGMTYLHFIILSNGQVDKIEILNTSGYEILDQSATKTIKRANPFPSFPDSLNQPYIRMRVGIVFELE